MSQFTFVVQSISAIGDERANVQFSQVNTGDPAAPWYPATLSLNLAQPDANGYNVNTRYALTLEPEVPLVGGTQAKSEVTQA